MSVGMKFPGWSCPEEATVNQESISGVPSPSLARVMESPCKGIEYSTKSKRFILKMLLILMNRRISNGTYGGVR